MQAVEAPFDLVITSNSGYPLDLNLYQGVKGMSAGARVLKQGGTLILACECSHGVPDGSSFDQLVTGSNSPEEILVRMATPGFRKPEQWQAQIQALIQKRARVLLYSSLAPARVQAAHLTPCHDISAVAREIIARDPKTIRVGVLPQGPLTIPFLA